MKNARHEGCATNQAPAKLAGGSDAAKNAPFTKNSVENQIGSSFLNYKQHLNLTQGAQACLQLVLSACRSRAAVSTYLTEKLRQHVLDLAESAEAEARRTGTLCSPSLTSCSPTFSKA
jgi:hypothetical protein